MTKTERKDADCSEAHLGKAMCVLISDYEKVLELQQSLNAA